MVLVTLHALHGCPTLYEGCTEEEKVKGKKVLDKSTVIFQKEGEFNIKKNHRYVGFQ